MPSRGAGRGALKATIGVAVATLPGALGWAPGFPAPAPAPRGQITFDATQPGSAAGGLQIALAAGEGHVVAAVYPSDTRPTRVVELGVGRPARLIHAFPRGATHPTVGTDAEGRIVVLVRTCASRNGEGKGADCGIDVVDLQSGSTRKLPSGRGARVAAMDRGATVLARGNRLELRGAPGTNGATDGATKPLPELPVERTDAPPGSIQDLDLRDGVIAATVDLSGEFGGSMLARYDASRGWIVLGVSTNGGGAIGPRAYYAPQVTPTGVRAFFDGAEDFGGYAGRWTTSSTPVTKVRAAPLGDPVHLRTAAFLGDRLVTFSDDDECAADDCGVPSFGPFPLG